MVPHDIFNNSEQLFGLEACTKTTFYYVKNSIENSESCKKVTKQKRRHVLCIKARTFFIN